MVKRAIAKKLSEGKTIVKNIALLQLIIDKIFTEEEKEILPLAVIEPSLLFKDRSPVVTEVTIEEQSSSSQIKITKTQLTAVTDSTRSKFIKCQATDHPEAKNSPIKHQKGILKRSKTTFRPTQRH